MWRLDYPWHFNIQLTKIKLCRWWSLKLFSGWWIVPWYEFEDTLYENMWHIVNGLLKNEHKSCRSKWDPTQTQLRWTWSRHPCGVPCGFNLFDFWLIIFPFLKVFFFSRRIFNNRNNKRIQQQHQVMICFYARRKIVQVNVTYSVLNSSG